MTEHASKLDAIPHAPGKIAIVGLGLIGCSWTIVFAKSGWQVSLQDINLVVLEVAQTTISDQLRLLQDYEICNEISSILSRINFKKSFETAVFEVDYVQECVTEIPKVKQDLFCKLDAISAPQTILASSTSGFMASEFSSYLRGRHRGPAAHPVNLSHLVPLVEISPSKWTDPDCARSAYDIMVAIKQTLVSVQKEILGFILNRLQGVLLNEALRLTQGRFASPEDIDKTVRDGPGLRRSFMGPFETIDLNAPAGLADYAKRYGPMYEGMAQAQAQPPDWEAGAIALLHVARREKLEIQKVGARQY